MKKMLISMLAMAAMVSCSSESDPIDEVNPQGDSKVEIKATAGINTIEAFTKAYIEPSQAVTDVAFARVEGNALWTTINAITTKGDIAATNGTITFLTPQYYPQKDAAKIIGYYPANTPISGVVSFTITGQEDIMCSNEVSANRNNIEEEGIAKFTFNHLLTQLKFKVKATDAEAISNWGKIKSISLINQKTIAKLTLAASSALSFTDDTNATNEIKITPNNFTAIDLTTEESATIIGNAIMVEASQSSYKVKVTTENSEATITLNNVTGTASTAYTVLLTFKGKNIVSAGTINAWEDNTSGTGEAE